MEKREGIERSAPLTLSFSSSPSKLNETSVNVLSHISTIKCLNLIKHHSTTRLRVVSFFFRFRDEVQERALGSSVERRGKRGHLFRLARFARRTREKERLFVVYSTIFNTIQQGIQRDLTVASSNAR